MRKLKISALTAVTLIISVFFFLNFIGCVSISNKDKELGISQALEPQAVLKFSDVPVPLGFRLLPLDSYSFESTGVRVGVLKYQGKANPEQVVNFYKEQMPLYNWNLLNVIEYGQRLLNFERESETCIISLLPKGNSVTLTISLGPKSMNTRRPKEPVK